MDNKEPIDGQSIAPGIKAIDVRQRGEWIPTTRINIFGEETHCYECSICGIAKIPLMSTLIFEKIPFCPNCGADMRKGGKE